MTGALQFLHSLGMSPRAPLILHFCLCVASAGKTEPTPLKVEPSADGSQTITLPAWATLTHHHNERELFGILQLEVPESQGRRRGLIFHDQYGYVGAASVWKDETVTELLCRVLPDGKASGGDHGATLRSEDPAILTIRGDKVDSYAHWKVMPVNQWPAEAAIDSSDSSIPMVLFKTPTSDTSDVAKIVIERGDQDDTDWKALLVHAYDSAWSQRCVPGGYSAWWQRVVADDSGDDWNRKPCRPLKDLHRCLLAENSLEQDALVPRTMTSLTFNNFGAFHITRQRLDWHAALGWYCFGLRKTGLNKTVALCRLGSNQAGISALATCCCVCCHR